MYGVKRAAYRAQQHVLPPPQSTVAGGYHFVTLSHESCGTLGWQAMQHLDRLAHVAVHSDDARWGGFKFGQESTVQVQRCDVQWE